MMVGDWTAGNKYMGGLRKRNVSLRESCIVETCIVKKASSHVNGP